MEKVFDDDVMNSLRVAQPQVVFDKQLDNAPPQVTQIMGSSNTNAEIEDTICPTITAKSGTGGNNQPIACIKEDQ